MREVKRGEIYYIKKLRSQTVGSEQIANRPGIIISNDIGNKYSENFGIVYLTTRVKANMPTHVTINSCTVPFSTALCEDIYTVSIYRLGQYMGVVTTEEQEKIDAALLISIGLDKKIWMNKYY